MNYRRYTKEQLERELVRNEDTYKRYLNCYLMTPNSVERRCFMNSLESTTIEYFLITANLLGKQFAEDIDKISEEFGNLLESHRLCSPLHKGEGNHGL